MSSAVKIVSIEIGLLSHIGLDHSYQKSIADSNTSIAGDQGSQNVSMFWNTLSS